VPCEPAGQGDRAGGVAAVEQPAQAGTQVGVLGVRPRPPDELVGAAQLGLALVDLADAPGGVRAGDLVAASPASARRSPAYARTVSSNR
jgi:hypothetical protein